MSHSASSARFFVPATLSSLAVVFAMACGGATDGGGSVQRVKPGDPCTGTGQAPSVDGCNTCTCTGGAWACTEKACVTEDGGLPSTCVPGTTRPAPDGCNTCTCDKNGTDWMCTLIGCSVCKEGSTTNDGCNSCSCVGGQWACTDRACPPPACIDGSTKMQDCNTCTCTNGMWGCTKMACPPPVCTDGATTNDGCNTCSCIGGQWACTARYCPPQDAGSAKKGCGGWLGDTCTQDEYCAYTEGQLCGAADASAVCAPRPLVCDTVYDPICGCDGKTYGNACEAAMARTGVNHHGVCN